MNELAQNSAGLEQRYASSVIKPSLRRFKRFSDTLNRLGLVAIIAILLGAWFSKAMPVSGGVLVAGISLGAIVLILARRNGSATRRLETRYRVCHLIEASRNAIWSDIRAPNSRIRLGEQEKFMRDLNVFGDFSLFRLLDHTSTIDGAQYLYDCLTMAPRSLQEVKDRRDLVEFFEVHPACRFRVLGVCNDRNVSIFGMQNGNQGTAVVPFRITAATYLGIWVLAITFSITLNFIFLVGAVLIYAPYYSKYSWLETDRTSYQFANTKMLVDIRKICTQIDRLSVVPSRFVAPFLNSRTGVEAHLKMLTLLSYCTWLDKTPMLRMVLNFVIPADRIIDLIYSKSSISLEKSAIDWRQSWAILEASASLAILKEMDGFTSPQFSVKNELSFVDVHNPLIIGRSVGNDVLIESGSIMFLTGSNMSGKSTTMRSIGMNVVLALAGARVKARGAIIPVLPVFVSFRADDDLEKGYSRFRSEVAVLSAINDVSQTCAGCLFFLDELLSSTNASERLIAIPKIMQKFANSGCIGVFSSHDEGLRDILSENSNVRIMHMEVMDSAADLNFTYKLREGPNMSKNALKILHKYKII